MGFGGNILSAITARFPLAEQGMAWLVPALVGAAIAFIFSGMSRKTA
jgi:branched-subunit amino acid permease